MYEINQDHFANPSSVYESGRKAKSLIEHARFQIAEAVGAKSSQIYFCSGGTEANNQVLWSLINQKNKHIIISAIEHPAINKVLERL
jgi:cysteine desulfurase